MFSIKIPIYNEVLKDRFPVSCLFLKLIKPFNLINVDQSGGSLHRLPILLRSNNSETKNHILKCRFCASMNCANSLMIKLRTAQRNTIPLI